MGQSVVTLGLSCEEGFVPLDSDLFISQTKSGMVKAMIHLGL